MLPEPPAHQQTPSKSTPLLLTAHSARSDTKLIETADAEEASVGGKSRSAQTILTSIRRATWNHEV